MRVVVGAGAVRRQRQTTLHISSGVIAVIDKQREPERASFLQTDRKKVFRGEYRLIDVSAGCTCELCRNLRLESLVARCRRSQRQLNIRLEIAPDTGGSSGNTA